MLKSYGVGGWWVVGGWVVVAWSNLVSAQGPLVLGLGLRVWGQGLTIHLLHCSSLAANHSRSDLSAHCSLIKEKFLFLDW